MAPENILQLGLQSVQESSTGSHSAFALPIVPFCVAGRYQGCFAGPTDQERLHGASLRDTRADGTRERTSCHVCTGFSLCSYLVQGDMVEYNQCQATLKTLYELGIPGKVEEFTAYRILMLLHGRNRSGAIALSPYLLPVEPLIYVLHAELNLFVGQLTPRQKADPAVRHALTVQRAQAMGNYHALFESYLSSPNMGAYIMDHFIDRERIKALIIMTKACA